ncbi:MAG: hypothetical protein H6554_01050 [Chitinophagales bacterium]|nr:hypothetical protein [Chitinophagales bacterium]
MYLDKSLKEAEKSKDYHLKGHLLDRMININGSIQDSKILAVVKQLIAERYTSLEYAHQADLSSFYRLLSNLHLDGLSLQKIGSNESNILQKIDAEIKQAPSTIFVADYLITKARFVFFDEPLLKSYTQEAKDYIYAQKMNTDSKNKLLRRLYFLEITSGFHFGYDVQEMLAVSQKMHAINLRYKFADAFGFLFYLLYLFANQKHNEMKLELQKNKTLFFRNENQYFINFIQVLSLINQGEYEKTVHYFQELSYASNFYISIWSKLIEFYVNFKLGNLRLCFSLLERIKQSLLKHKLLTFTCESSTILLKVYRKLLQNPTMTLGSLPEGIKSPLHVFLFTQLSKN